MGLNAISHGAVSEVADRVRRRRHGALADQLPLAGIEDDGLVLLDDGALVRVFEVQPINTLVLDEPHVERLAAQAHRLLARIPVGQLLSLYVQSEPLRVDRLLAREQTIAARVAAHQIQADGPELGEATRRLAFVEAHSLATHVPILPASRVRYFLAVPLGPAREDRPRRLRRGEPPRTSIDAFETTGDEHARFVSSVLMGLKAMRLSSRALSGPELIDLLWSRCSPDLADHGRTPPSRAAAAPTGSLTNAATPLEAMERAASLKECICQESLEPATRSYLRWEGSVEQVVRLGGLPEETWLGWLQHLTLSTLPFTLAVHFHARDRFREKRRQK
ncbi:MAG: hypothetical protein JWQ48_3437, partial [Conexibacter sp.]|nr:hypothetical protein [Conexibacter sp.]